MATVTGNIYPEDEIALNKANAESWLIHGTCFYNGYIYGVPRVSNNTVPNHNAIFKVKADDYSVYTAVAMKDALGVDLSGGTQIVACGGYLFAGLFAPNNSGLLKIDPDTLVHTLLFPNVPIDGMDSDGTFLYWGTGNGIAKYNPTTDEIEWSTIPINSFNDNSQAPSYMGQGASPHSVLVDDTYVWYNVVLSYYPNDPPHMVVNSRIHKVLKSDMSYIGYAVVAQVTDDMGQNDDYIFCGHEPPGSDSYGYTWGASAVRKSDLAVFPLPKLAASDTASIISYASLRFGTYLIDCKTNNHLYVIDITDPSQWSINSDPNDFVLFDYHIIDTMSNDTHNEIVMDNQGKFHETTWCLSLNYHSAFLRRIIIPTLAFTSAPEVLTVGATDVTSTFATLNGYIRASGGREILDNGFIIGTQSGSYGSPVSTIAVPEGSFSLLIENLTPGQTYYYKSYATNSIGTTYSGESSFVMHSSATVPSILGTVEKDSALINGATVFLVNVGGGSFVGKKLSNDIGRFAFTGLLLTSKYHAVTEYTDPSLGKWNAKSFPYLTPVLE